MTPDQLEIIEAFKRVTFRPEHKKFVDALIATAKQAPGTMLNDKQTKAISDLAFKYRRQMPVGLVIKQGEQAYPTLSWMAPDMRKAGGLKDEPWVPDNARRAVALFPNKSLHTCAALLAALHPFAYDYIVQAPVLVLAVAQGSTLGKVAERKRVAREWVSRFEKGGKLRDIMAHVNIAYPLRKLHPSILEATHWDTVQALCTIEASTLSQIIPEREDQKEWLHSIGQWAAQVARRFQNRVLHFEWACRQLTPANLRALNQDVREVLNNVATIADFAGQPGTRFNVRWTIDRAMTETRRWHDELARRTNEERFFAEHGHGWDHPVDYMPFPCRVRMGDYEFHALRSGKDLFEEGREMHHCVGAYSADVIKGVSRIYSMVDHATGRRVATVEFSHHKHGFMGRDANARYHMWEIGGEPGPDGRISNEMRRYQPQWFMIQAKGPCNAPPSIEARHVIKEFEDRLNYYWAMFLHEAECRAKWQTRLERTMLTVQPMLIPVSEFPDLCIDAVKIAKIEEAQAKVLAEREQATMLKQAKAQMATAVPISHVPRAAAAP